jgi:hypothetical protein
MKKILQLCIVITITINFTAPCLFAQMDDLYGDFTNNASGIHEGNLFRTTFYNDGTWGVNQRPPDIGGEWPKNTAHIYMLDGNTFVGSEVVDIEGQTQYIVSEVRSVGTDNNTSYSTGDIGPDGRWRTFLPLPGFHNSNPPDDKSDQPRIAMNKWEWSWPEFWPDIGDTSNEVYSADAWAGSWNGYFGRDKQNADEESYFVSDDYANNEFAFYPDSTDSLRRGLGLRMYCRGFQWNNALVDDGLFTLMDIKNIGTHEHDKMVYAFKIGNNVGETENNYASEGEDDCGRYLKEEDLAYLYDGDDDKAPDWGDDPVGYFGAAFLESPGNPFDGIDNDNDGKDGPGPDLTLDMLESSTILTLNSTTVFIDYTTYERKVMTFGDTLANLGSDTLIFKSENKTFKFWDGKTIEEIENDLFDNNLNGLIDENNGSLIGDPPIQKYLYWDEVNNRGYKYIDYITGEGSDNLLIEEKRDDNIDNDGDWDIVFDDVGADGLGPNDRGYPGADNGEGDGIPTAGEPHFDKTDIDETDMLGLTGFTLYRWPDMPHWEDELVWNNALPGFFDDRLENDNIELFFSSGYFPLKPDQTERFSMALFCGWDETDLIENKYWFARAYHENYNFSKAPNTPTVRAIVGNNRVTLIWDSFAEESVDPITGEDFEGYAIYRSTDDQWKDLPILTDYNGVPTQFRIPLAQFDLNNEYSGICPIDIKGVHWNYGDNTGLVHSWVDTTAQNGFTYFYAVTAYDHGDLENNIPPTECSKSISRDPVTDTYTFSSNVVRVKPEAPSAGYVAADKDTVMLLPGGTAEGSVNVNVVDPDSVLNCTYRIVFEDTTIGNRDYPATKNFSLIDVTEDTVLIDKSTLFHEGDELPVIRGFQLAFDDLGIERLDFNPEPSRWNRAEADTFRFRPFNATGKQRYLISTDYMLVIGDVGIDTSTAWYRSRNLTPNYFLPAIPINFKVVDLNENKKIKVAFRERDMATAADEGKLTIRTQEDVTNSDVIYFLTDSLDENSQNVASWEFFLYRSGTDTIHNNPASGDTLRLELFNPFLSNDIFEFTTNSKSVDEKLAKNQMNRIKVVPNPYIVTNWWESKNPYATGRGPRVLHFTHLPSKCTIHIFNLRGQLVDTIEHETADLADGTAIWDLRTKDDLDIAYGVYIYHIDAPGVGSKIGKFAIIK